MSTSEGFHEVRGLSPWVACDVCGMLVIAYGDSAARHYQEIGRLSPDARVKHEVMAHRAVDGKLREAE